MSEPRPPEHALALQIDDDVGVIEAVFTPAPEAALPSLDELKELVAAADCSEWYFLTENAVSFLAAARRARTPVSKPLAERRDGQFVIKIAQDEMAANLTLEQAYGGRAVTAADIAAELESQGISHGVLQPEIAAAIAAGSAEARPIARGERPENGRDARFVYLLKAQSKSRPVIDERGVADFRDLGTFATVEPGVQLMRRVPATPGRAGRNIFGLVVPPKPGRDTPYAAGLRGTRLADDDPNLLLADSGGLPVPLPDGVMVDPVINVDTIDLSVGNIEFDGAVQIKGDVAPGLKVVANSDVLVGGTVEGAIIEAGGNVTVKGGIVGHSPVRAEVGESGSGSARIRCGGSLSARFIVNAYAECGDSVQVHNEIAHSEITAKNHIVVGLSKADKGQIVGGDCCARLGVRAAVLGSPASVPTRITVGRDPEAVRTLRELEKEIRERDKQHSELEKALQHLEGQDPQGPRVEKIRAALAALTPALEELEARRAELQAQLATVAEAEVVVTRSAYGNVHLCVGDAKLQLRDERGPSHYGLEDGKVVFRAGAKAGSDISR